MNSELNNIKYRIEMLENEVRNLQGRNNALHIICIVLTAVLTATFMHVFTL